jgi:hypothetical protein
MLEIENPRHMVFEMRERFLGAPLTLSVDVRVSHLTTTFNQVITNGAIDPDRSAPLLLEPWDCLANAPHGTRFALPDLPDATLCYPDPDRGFPLSCTAAPTTMWGSAIVVDVPEPQRSDWVRVRAVREEMGELVAERDGFVRGGWQTTLVLFPLTR